MPPADPFTVSLDDLDEDNLDQSAKEFAQSKSEAEDLIHVCHPSPVCFPPLQSSY